MSSPQNIVESLYAALTAPGNLATALGGRVYYNDGPQNQDQPYLVYSMLQDPIARNFDNSITYGADVHFDIWIRRELGTAGALGAGTIEEYLFALDGTTLAVNGLDRGKLLFTNRGVPEVLEDTIRVSSEARIHGTTSGSGFTLNQVYLTSTRAIGTPAVATGTSPFITGETVVPAALLTAGTLIRVNLGAYLSSAAGAATYCLLLRVGGTVGGTGNGSIMLTLTPDFDNATATIFLHGTFEMVIHTTGVAGTIFGKGHLIFGVNEQPVTTLYSDVGGLAQTFDMTADLPVKWVSKFAAPDAATTLNPLYMSVEVTGAGGTITLT